MAIVRSLLMHPEIILFDEVQPLLDPLRWYGEVLEFTNDLAQEGRTMILVTHENNLLKLLLDQSFSWTKDIS